MSCCCASGENPVTLLIGDWLASELVWTFWRREKSPASAEM